MNPTGSSIERGMQCAAAFALPKAGHTGEAAIKGTENHEAIEDGLVVGGDISHLPEAVQRALDGALKVDVEVAFALDVEKERVRLIGRRLARNYGPLGDTEIALTIDAIVTKPKAAGGWGVWDWKSRKRVTTAARNWQIKAGCVAVMLYEQLSEVTGGIGYLDNGETDSYPFDAFDIPLFFADMRSMLNRIGAARALAATGQTPDVHSGSWCDYCPAMPYCPAHTRLALSMLGELEEVRKDIAFMTPEQVGRAWVLKKRIESMLETVDESLRQRIAQGFIPLESGKRLAVVDCKRTSFDAAKAKKRLQELGEDLSKFNRVVEYGQVKEVTVFDTAKAKKRLQELGEDLSSSIGSSSTAKSKK